MIPGSVFAFEFKGQFWSKKNCRELRSECLPRAISSALIYQLMEPEINSSTTLKIIGKDFDAQLFYARKSQAKDYYVFQIELLNKAGKTLGICSRYESLDTVENVPVGACGVKWGGQDLLVGFSIMLVD